MEQHVEVFFNSNGPTWKNFKCKCECCFSQLRNMLAKRSVNMINPTFILSSVLEGIVGDDIDEGTDNGVIILCDWF